jgi:integrase
MSANPDNPAQHGVSWGALIDHYISEEMPRRTTTRRGYFMLLNNFIRPKWGDYAIADVTSFAVREWLKTLTRTDCSRLLTPKTKVNIRSLMHTLYLCACRSGFATVQANPFAKGLVPIKDADKTMKKARILTVAEFRRLLRHRLLREEPFRTMVILAMCLGFRCSELLALKWSDIDRRRRIINVDRRIVSNEIDDPKTQESKSPLPLAPEVARVLDNWKKRCPFSGPDDFVFASPSGGGKNPYEPHGLQQNRIRVAGLEMGLGDGIGWHSFRHTYCSLLDDLGAPLRVQQRLMRHAHPKTTLKYGAALESSNRKANSKVVGLVFRAAAK